MKLTEHFTYEELTRSATALRYGIDNNPNDTVKAELNELAQMLETIRKEYNKPIIVTSGYRCKRLNDIVGGSRTSQHVKGQAADIRSLSDTTTDNKELFDTIVKMINNNTIKVGQLIDEYNYNWVHVSTPKLKINNQIKHIR